MARKRRKLPEINAGSMADISFLLLIFFLVSASMDTDMGIVRKLPPMPPTDEPVDKPVEVKERNIFVVLVNREDQLLVEGELMDLKNLREATKNFIDNPYSDENLPAKEVVDIPIFGPMEITNKHVISLQNDRGTSYEMYIAVQNELAAAYDELRNLLSMRKFGVRYDELKGKEAEAQREAIEAVYPMKISEAEPKNVGGL
jgi:biopolymer transport protein ExbD